MTYVLRNLLAGYRLHVWRAVVINTEHAPWYLDINRSEIHTARFGVTTSSSIN
jgi:hypothetical protein